MLSICHIFFQKNTLKATTNEKNEFSHKIGAKTHVQHISYPKFFWGYTTRPTLPGEENPSPEPSPRPPHQMFRGSHFGTPINIPGYATDSIQQ